MKPIHYIKVLQKWEKTKKSTVPIGERRAPVPEGRPGFIRVDSVHQGDRDGVKGVYHINAADYVTHLKSGRLLLEKISEEKHGDDAI